MRITFGRFVLYVFLLALILPFATDALIYAVHKIVAGLTTLARTIGTLLLWIVGIALGIRMLFSLKDLSLRGIHLRTQNLALEEIEGRDRVPLGSTPLMAFDPVLERDDRHEDEQYVFDDLDSGEDTGEELGAEDRESPEHLDFSWENDAA